MSLHPKRTRSYLCGALTGAFTVVALLGRRESRRLSWLALGAAVVFGVLSVAYEEAAQTETE
jgi:hypothetical protein